MSEGTEKDIAPADLALIGAAQRVEHYEIAAYTTARNLALHFALTSDRDAASSSLRRAARYRKGIMRTARAALPD